MLKLKGIHHIAIIATHYERSKAFYTQVLGFTIEKETYRQERQSYKLDLSLNGQYTIELFSFPQYVPRPTRPEAAGLRHLAFAVEQLDEAVQYLHYAGVITESIRLDVLTGKRFVFFTDPDGLPLELYEL